MTLRVAIAGAGIGGLCLAQGLIRHDIDVTVYEADPTRTARRQGYRLRIDRHGHDALRQCLPHSLFRLYQATANEQYMSRGMVYDERLRLLFSHARDRPLDPDTATRGVNRSTLREVLSMGLGERLRFGCRVTGFDTDADGVVVRLDSAERERFDVLVGADGINSTVRGLLAPHARVLDTGLRAIYGQAPLDERLRLGFPKSVICGSVPVLGPDRCTLALGTYQPVVSPRLAATALTPVGDYLKWTLVAPMSGFAMAEDEFWRLSPVELTEQARRRTAEWHRQVRYLIAKSDAELTFPLAVRVAERVPRWPTGRVTLLGDAVHATTPVGGTGANTALRDAAVLTEALRDADASATSVRAALDGYQTRMRGYAEEVLRRSRRGAQRIFYRVTSQ